MKIKTLTLLALALLATVMAKGDIVIYPNSIVTGNGGQGTTCPAPYAGYANYTRTIAQGWGWAPQTNTTTVFTATDTNRTDTKIQFVGKFGDNGCSPSPVTVPNPPYSPKYRFTVYFPTNTTVPTGTNYPLVLKGFDP